MIEARGLSKRYGEFKAVDSVTFSIGKGEVVGFLGPNGAGKTTTMRILTGFLPPTDGTAVIAGHDIFDDPLAARRVIGYLPETPPLYPEMTVVSLSRLRGAHQGRAARASAATRSNARSSAAAWRARAGA